VSGQSAVGGRRVGRRTLLRALGAGALLALSGISQPLPIVAADICAGPVLSAPARPIAPAAASVDLPAPFGYRPDSTDRAAVLANVAAVVRGQAEDLGAAGCYLGKPAAIAERVDFLSPYEFLVVTMYEQDHAHRDSLLDQYASDPRGAIQALAEHYPSNRAQSIMMNYAYFDIGSDRIRVNAARVPAADVRRVLVHEFWHAMPDTRVWREGADRTVRANGFWLQERRGNVPVWLPVDEQGGLPYQSYLLDEAMATMMETRYAGPSPMARREVDEVQAYLSRLMTLAGPADVLGSYLASEPHELEVLTEEHRASISAVEPLARP
jgi:hypothetical protein